MKLNYSKKIFILGLVTFVCVIILDIIFTDLLVGKIMMINNKVQQLVISSDERERELNLKDSIRNSDIARVELEKYFIGAGDAETVAFTKSLEDLARASSVAYTIRSLNYEMAPDLGGSASVSLIRFSFTIKGQWSNVMTFLKLVENLPNVVLVNNASLSVSDGDIANAKQSIWSADVDFSVAQLKN